MRHLAQKNNGCQGPWSPEIAPNTHHTRKSPAFQRAGEVRSDLRGRGIRWAADFNLPPVGHGTRRSDETDSVRRRCRGLAGTGEVLTLARSLGRGIQGLASSAALSPILGNLRTEARTSGHASSAGFSLATSSRLSLDSRRRNAVYSEWPVGRVERVRRECPGHVPSEDPGQEDPD